jgi:thiol-disulfide isomerase/thioredoxin
MAPRAKIIIDSKAKAEQFKKTLGENKPILILYHAHWCPHCVHFVGAHHEDSYPWQQICKKLNDTVVCVEVESEHMKWLEAEHNQVRGFPTIMYMRGGYKTEFGGNRNDPTEVQKFITAEMKQVAGCGCGGRVGGTKRRPKTAGAAPKVLQPKVLQPKARSQGARSQGAGKAPKAAAQKK